MLLKCTKLEKQARKNMQELSFELYARLNLKYALLTPSICAFNWGHISLNDIVSNEEHVNQSEMQVASRSLTKI